MKAIFIDIRNETIIGEKQVSDIYNFLQSYLIKYDLQIVGKLKFLLVGTNTRMEIIEK